MPLENFEEEGLEKIPDLELAQKVFLLTTNKRKNDVDLKNEVLNSIIKEDMAPYYEQVCSRLGWTSDGSMLEKMKTANKEKIAELDKKITDAEASQGEAEVRDAMLERAHYRSKIGDKDAALNELRKIYEKTVMIGYRLDLVFHQIRMGFFFEDRDLITRNIDKANTLIEEGGDWDRRNRLRVYRGFYCLSVRDFKAAANLLLDTVATFTSYELMDYRYFITYTVLASMVALPRAEVYDKVVRGSEIVEVLHGLPEVAEFLRSLYECRYADFLRALAGVESFLQDDRYLSTHARYYVREMRIKAYAQQLQSYSSLSLEYMARSFGVTVQFIDRELARFIAAGRLAARIDQVAGVVETCRPDSKNFQYQSTIKQGDHLLNRVQKLSRVINI